MDGNGKELKLLEQQIQIQFSNKFLLQKSMTHKSFANENRSENIKDNERLEFLGDAVLDLVISEYIFRQHPEFPEGELAKMRAVVVSAPTLARTSKGLNLGQYLRLGKGEELTGGRERDSILADTFEALVGAIYLDQGLEVVRSFILGHLKQEILLVERGEHLQDYKTLLQEEIQKRSNTRPIYRVIDETGPDHNKQFTIQVEYKNRVIGIGSGQSKKEAQQRAAKDAIAKIDEVQESWVKT